MNDNELEHVGVKGMHWGQRKVEAKSGNDVSRGKELVAKFSSRKTSDVANEAQNKVVSSKILDAYGFKQDKKGKYKPTFESTVKVFATLALADMATLAASDLISGRVKLYA